MALDSLQTLIDQLCESAEAPAVVAFDAERPEIWSRGDLCRTARRFAAGLLRHGVAKEEVVGLLGPNRPEWIAALLGIVRAGAVAMPLPEQMTDHELGRVIAHSGCRRVVTTGKRAKSFAALDLADDFEVIVLDEPPEGIEGIVVRTWSELLEDEPGDLPELGAERQAVLLYTSGTTGTPKGVPLTHGNLCANFQALLDAGLAEPGDRLFLPLPLHHTYPLTVGVLAPLALGAPIMLPAGITGPQIMAALREGRCTIMVGVPRLYEALIQAVDNQVKARGAIAALAFRGMLAASVWARRRLGWRLGRRLFGALHRRLGPDLRLLASGGARLDPEIAWRLEGLGWEVLTGYGLTETSPILTFNLPGRARIESVGQPIEGVELRIAEQEGTEPGQGEVQARGPSVFRGYFDNPEATEESFTEDGFFRTGDLGYLDDNDFLYIVGRSKELIVLAGGKNVFPDEVEAVYGETTLAREVAVLEHDNRLVALFVPAPEAIKGRSLDDLKEELRKEMSRLAQRLPSYQRVADFAITRQPLPRTQIGKLRRHELPEIYEQETSAGGRPRPSPIATEADRELIETPPASEIWAWLNERFQGQTLTLDTSPQFDLNLDSFDWMSLAMELEERFGVRLSEDALGRIMTLRDLLQESLEAAEAGTGVEEAETRRLTPEQERALAPRGRALTALGAALYGLNRIVIRLLFRVRVEGLERVPADGPLLITPNHLSYLDPFVIAAALPWHRARHLYWAGWTGLLFRGPLTRLFSRACQVVPVDPERGITSTLAIGRAVLDQGSQLVWFPEGERSSDGELHRFLPGVGWLLDKTGARAQPVLAQGTFEAWPPDRKLPRPGRVEVRFGEPIEAPRLKRDGDDNVHAAMADRLREAVAALAASGRRELPDAAE
jgi:long-chain acyl-CoA synthetase